MVACKTEHRLSTGKHAGHEYYRIGVLEYETGKYPNVERVFAPILCMNCRTAPCIDVCPVPGAIYRSKEGIVLIDRQRCDGCKQCMQVCPYGALYFDEEHHIVDKCDLCSDRISEGLAPACVAACMGRAMIFGDLDDPGNEISQRVRKDGVKPDRPLWPKYFGQTFKPAIFYTGMAKP